MTVDELRAELARVPGHAVVVVDGNFVRDCESGNRARLGSTFEIYVQYEDEDES